MFLIRLSRRHSITNAIELIELPSSGSGSIIASTDASCVMIDGVFVDLVWVTA